jgi:branched-chain amino acid transport system ATP-binding protein
VLQFIGLNGQTNNYLENMTAFERKFLQIVKMIAIPLELALFDEIMVGLSPAETKQMVALIRRLNQGGGITVILIGHIMPIFITTCNQIIVPNFGEKIACGGPQEIAQDVYLGDEAYVTP